MTYYVWKDRVEQNKAGGGGGGRMQKKKKYRGRRDRNSSARPHEAACVAVLRPEFLHVRAKDSKVKGSSPSYAPSG